MNIKHSLHITITKMKKDNESNYKYGRITQSQYLKQKRFIEQYKVNVKTFCME